jgi:ribonuclease P protein component
LPHPERFSRTARLLTAADFKRVFQDPIKTNDALFTVLARPNDRRDARLGLAISKKNVRMAVDRNRVKRLVRESFRKRQASLAGLDLVVLGRRGLGDQPNPLILESLRGHWEKLARQ